MQGIACVGTAHAQALKNERQRKVRGNEIRGREVEAERTADVSQEVTRTMNCLLCHPRMTEKSGTCQPTTEKQTGLCSQHS